MDNAIMIYNGTTWLTVTGIIVIGFIVILAISMYFAGTVIDLKNKEICLLDVACDVVAMITDIVIAVVSTILYAAAVVLLIPVAVVYITYILLLSVVDKVRGKNTQRTIRKKRS